MATVVGLILKESKKTEIKPKEPTKAEIQAKLKDLASIF